MSGNRKHSAVHPTALVFGSLTPLSQSTTAHFMKLSQIFPIVNTSNHSTLEVLHPLTPYMQFHWALKMNEASNEWMSCCRHRTDSNLLLYSCPLDGEWGDISQLYTTWISAMGQSRTAFIHDGTLQLQQWSVHSQQTTTCQQENPESSRLAQGTYCPWPNRPRVKERHSAHVQDTNAREEKPIPSYDSSLTMHGRSLCKLSTKEGALVYLHRLYRFPVTRLFTVTSLVISCLVLKARTHVLWNQIHVHTSLNRYLSCPMLCSWFQVYK